LSSGIISFKVEWKCLHLKKLALEFGRRKWPFYLTNGSRLGAVREWPHNGVGILWDDDGDIFVDGGNSEKVNALREELFGGKKMSNREY
jgi:hypothetical protein